MPAPTFFDRVLVRHVALGATVTTFFLILLGVYTGATGSGLACSAQWPLCDDGLFPQSLPSLIEWLHRFFAMVAGAFFLGLLYGGWRYYQETRIRLAVTTAIVVLPIQVLLGGATVIQYTPEIQTAHHAAAMIIFTAVLAATLWMYDADAAL